jgi:hypothetical protein
MYENQQLLLSMSLHHPQLGAAVDQQNTSTVVRVAEVERHGLLQVQPEERAAEQWLASPI